MNGASYFMAPILKTLELCYIDSFSLWFKNISPCMYYKDQCNVLSSALPNQFWGIYYNFRKNRNYISNLHKRSNEKPLKHRKHKYIVPLKRKALKKEHNFNMVKTKFSPSDKVWNVIKGSTDTVCKVTFKRSHTVLV